MTIKLCMIELSRLVRTHLEYHIAFGTILGREKRVSKYSTFASKTKERTQSAFMWNRKLSKNYGQQERVNMQPKKRMLI